MDANLNLKLDADIIRQAKLYAQNKKQSLSSLIENYLSALVQEKKEAKSMVEITPFVKSMRGGVSIPLDIDYKEERSKYLTEKYK